jgi:hypothetical protein
VRTVLTVLAVISAAASRLLNLGAGFQSVKVSADAQPEDNLVCHSAAWLSIASPQQPPG